MESEIISIEHDWVPTFLLIPRRSISGSWLWGKHNFVRRVWRMYPVGLCPEPETEFGSLFDIVKGD